MKDRDLWARLKDCAFPLQDGKSTLRRRLNAMTKLGEERVDRVINEYRRFLYLAAIGPMAVPSKLVDYVWHMHLADTRAYASFCADVIGTFIHHAPGRVAQNDDPAYPRTLKAYADEFGEEPFWRIWPYRVGMIAVWTCVMGIAGAVGLFLALLFFWDLRLLFGMVPVGLALWLYGYLTPWSANMGRVSRGSGGSNCGGSVTWAGDGADVGFGGEGGGGGD